MARSVVYGAAVTLDAGNNKWTNLADGVAADDAATVGQISGGGVGFDVVNSGGFFEIETTSEGGTFGVGIALHDTDAGSPGILLTSESGGVTLQADASSVSLFSTDVQVLITAGVGIDAYLEAGTAFTVYDSGANPIFRVNEDGSLQGKTGEALTFDL